MAKTEKGETPDRKTPARPVRTKRSREERLEELDLKLKRLNRETLMEIASIRRTPKQS